MVRIKICGIRRFEDVKYLNELMVDYAGFIFAPSKRRVDVELASKLIERLDSRIKKVGVFVNEKRSTINYIVNKLNIDVIQLHGDETPDDVNGYDVQVWKAIRVKDAESLKIMEDYDVDGFVLDSAKGDANKGNCLSYGGTGEVFDWTLLQNLSFEKPLILAGGLTKDNVCDGINIVKPYAVDVSSGVETNGCKDYIKMKEFVERVRSL